jgi:hypothetical protein
VTVIADAVLAHLVNEHDEVSQALALLRASGVAEAERLALGDGDRRLLELHRAVIGHDVEVMVACHLCEARNTVTVGPGSVPRAAPRSAWWGPSGGLREPTYQDLRGLPVDPDLAIEALLVRCTVGQPSRPATAADLRAVDDALTGPVRLVCVGCGQPIEVELDIQRAVVSRLVAWGRSVDVEIHLLARTYHWDLATIEGLSDARRRRLAGLVRDK